MNLFFMFCLRRTQAMHLLLCIFFRRQQFCFKRKQILNLLFYCFVSDVNKSWICYFVLFQTGHEQIVPGERRHRTLYQLVRGGKGSRRSQAARRHGVQTLGIINFPNLTILRLYKQCEEWTCLIHCTIKVNRSKVRSRFLKVQLSKNCLISQCSQNNEPSLNYYPWLPQFIICNSLLSA